MNQFITTNDRKVYAASISGTYGFPVLMVEDVTSSFPSIAFDASQEKFFDVTIDATSKAITLTENTTPSSNQIAWWLKKFVNPNSKVDALAIIAMTFPSVDSTTREDAAESYRQARL
jgi:hypothetical protein